VSTHRDPPDAPPTPAEIAEAEALRDALADPSAPRRLDAAGRAGEEAARFARAVSVAHAPRPLDADRHRAILEKVLAPPTRRTGKRLAYVLALGGAAAAAAMALLFVRSPASAVRPAAPSVSVSVEPLVPLRSTQPLFAEPFAPRGGASARIDRIAVARAADLRDNRFAAWGVR